MSFLPRLAVGIVAGLLAKVLTKKNSTVAYLITGALGSLTNTVGYLGMLYVIFRDLLATQYGYHAEAPFSGTQYDLLQGRMTVYTEGKRIEQKAIPGGDARAAAAYNSLVEAAQALLALVKNLQMALGQHIDELDWMGDETKAKAHDKLDNFTVKIGYPDKWKDYSTLDIDPNVTYYENLRNANRWYVADNLSKLGKPTDRTEWGMTPQTVNAYYNPTTNEICFPAGILQKPFFDPDADIPVNYGAIGVVIGHEMSHGFDDQGSMFDAKGNMSNWWTAEDKAKFAAKGDALAAQFDAVEVLPGLMANGRYTLGENIGDHGGLSFAFSAMQNALKDHPQGLVDGLTPEQRFYLSYANVWAANITDEEKARRTNMDVHSLGVNRVNVSIRNFDSFFKAFDIKEGDPMFRPEEERVHIW